VDSEEGVGVVRSGCERQRVCFCCELNLEDDETSHTLGGAGEGGT
jgi:hypothetical protein